MNLLDLLYTYCGPPTNYIGAAIFLVYILAALILTFSLAADLREKYQETRFDENSRIRLSRRTAAAYFSFGVLSYHMLFFLFLSYRSWSERNNIPLPSRENDWKLEIARWMLDSSLFTDFAKELAGDGPSCVMVWTITALIWTGGVNVWMAVEGKRYRMHNLLQYIVLAQILPISFAQSLFAIDVLISRAQTISTSERVGSQHSLVPHSSRGVLWRNLESILCLTAWLATLWAINEIPSHARQPDFLIFVAAVRLMLFIPYLLRPHDKRAEERTRERSLKNRSTGGNLAAGVMGISAAVVVALAVNRIPPEERTIMKAWRGLNSGMAVKALGWDLIIGISSFIMIWLEWL